MTKQVINVGTSANDGTGDTLRAAAQKINSNFTEVYGTAQAAFNAANNAGGGGSTIDSFARTKANSATTLAQAAFNSANTATENLGNVRINSTTISTAHASQPLVFKTYTASGDDNEIYMGTKTVDIYAYDDDVNSYSEIYLDNSNTVDPHANIVIKGQNTDEKVWSFGSDGSLQLPISGDILNSNGDSVLNTNVTQLIGNEYNPGTGIKRTVYTNFNGYQGGESTHLYISHDNGQGIGVGDTITFRNGEVRTITEVNDFGVGDYYYLAWNGDVSGGELNPRYPVTLQTADYSPEIKSTARIKPNPFVVGSGQYMDVYAGAPAVIDNKHIHMAGHNPDTELFLGTDNNFVSAKEAGNSPARVNLKSENDITVSDTNLRMTRGSTWASIYGDGVNRNFHNQTYDLTWNVIETDKQGNYYVGGESCSWSEGMIAKYGPDGELIWKKIIDADSGFAGWEIDGIAYDSANNEVGVLVQTDYNKDYRYYKLATFDANTGDYKNTDDIYDNDGSIDAYNMIWHPTLGYSVVGRTYGEIQIGNTITSTGSTGVGIIELPINDVLINGQFPDSYGSWRISGNNITGSPVLQTGYGLYQNLPLTTVTGSGSGATATIRIVYNTGGHSYEFFNNGNQQGSNYANGDQLKILGSLLGGVDGVNDLTCTAVENGALYNITSVAGTPNPTNFRYDMSWSMGYGSTDFTGGIFTFKYVKDSRGYVWTKNWAKYYESADIASATFAYSIAVDKYDGGLVVGGYDNHQSKGYVWKLNSNGTTSWAHAINDNDSVYSVCTSAVDGSVYFTTDYNSVNKLNSLGNLIKRVEPYGPWGHYRPLVEIEQSLDGQEYLYIGASFGSIWVSNGGFLVNKLNTNLEIIWTRDMWYSNESIYTHYDIFHKNFILGKDKVSLVGYGRIMSNNYENGFLLSLSTTDNFESGLRNNWHIETPGDWVKYNDVTSSYSITNLLTANSTVQSSSLSYSPDESGHSWSNWTWKSATVNLNNTDNGIVGIESIKFVDGGKLDHNPSDIPQSPTDFFRNGWNYTLQLSDRGKFIINQQVPNDSYCESLYITVPSNRNVSFPIGTVITLINASSADAGGYRIYVQPQYYSNDDCPRIWATGGNQNWSTWSFQGIQTATLMKIGSNEWLLTANDITNED